ncbi:MAG: hypothetical protein WBA13_12705 [Microcoleaceae cyanobacterium]
MIFSILINLKQAFFIAAGFWETRLTLKPGNWCKYVESVDKDRTDGYSLLGPFVSQIDQLAQQQPGLYLYCEKKKRKNGISQRLYTLFVLESDGNIQVLQEIKTASKDWAVQLWVDIDAYFVRQSRSVERRRQQLKSEIQTLEFELSQRRAELVALDLDAEEF